MGESEMKDIEVIEVGLKVTIAEMVDIDRNKGFKELIIRGLKVDLGRYIVENEEYLPIETSIYDNFSEHAKEIKVKAILISSKELKRLKDIEQDYVKMLHSMRE